MKSCRCECGGIIKPDVVLYGGRSLDNQTMEDAVFIRQADVLIIGGTSLAVYPAAGLIDYYKGDKLILVNKISHTDGWAGRSAGTGSHRRRFFPVGGVSVLKYEVGDIVELKKKHPCGSFEWEILRVALSPEMQKMRTSDYDRPQVCGKKHEKFKKALES